MALHAIVAVTATARLPGDHIGFFYNPQRKHIGNGMMLPIDFEQLQKQQGVQRLFTV